MKKAFKIPKSLKILSIIILSLMFIWAFFFGWGWFVPYNLQPSYWKFKNSCGLDTDIYEASGGKLDEKYYNKVLAYFDTDLDSLDWDTIGKAAKQIGENSYYYNPNETRLQYVYSTKKDRIEYIYGMYFKDKADRQHLIRMYFSSFWDTRRYELEGNEGSGFWWNEYRLYCDKVYCKYENDIKVCSYE